MHTYYGINSPDFVNLGKATAFFSILGLADCLLHFEELDSDKFRPFKGHLKCRDYW